MTRRRLSATFGAGALLLAVLLSPSATATAATVISVPSSIDASGRTDVTQPLMSLIATAPTGATVRFPSGGRYRIDGVVFVTGRHEVTIDGNGSTLVAPTDGTGTPVPRYNLRGGWPRLRAHVVVEDSSGITIHDLTVQGPNPSGTFKAPLEGQAGFMVARSTDVTLEHVTARATYGDGVYIVGHSQGITIQDCTLDHNGRQGVAVVDGVDVTVQRCSISGTGRSAIDLEPAGGAARSVHVQDNEVHDVTNMLLAAGGAGVNVSDVWLMRNHVTGGRGVAVYAGQRRFLRTGIHVIDNTGTGASRGLDRELMHFERFDGVEVKGNRQAVAKGVTPIMLVNSCHADVSGNDFNGASGTPTATGDCNAPGLAPVTSSTTRPLGVDRRAVNAAQRAARRAAVRANRARALPATPPSTAAPAPVIVSRGGGTSPVMVALAFLAGALAGGGALVLYQWSRAGRPSAPAPRGASASPGPTGDDERPPPPTPVGAPGTGAQGTSDPGSEVPDASP